MPVPVGIELRLGTHAGLVASARVNQNGFHLANSVDQEGLRVKAFRFLAKKLANRLMGQCGGLQGVIHPFTGEQTTGNAAEFGINGR